MIGRFETEADGSRVGTFIGRAEHAGDPVLARFIWNQISVNAAHWQQAFSADDGATWETNWHMWMRRIDERIRIVHDDAVVELRQYTLQPGERDVLIELFEREFVEPQEAVGMHVIGHFRDLDAPDRFVWLRGFPSMAARQDALQSFYFGPVWQRHRDCRQRDHDRQRQRAAAEAGAFRCRAGTGENRAPADRRRAHPCRRVLPGRLCAGPSGGTRLRRAL